MVDLQSLFAERIGGTEFGRVNKVFKFTLIDQAKKEFIAKYPSVRVIDMGVGEPEERAADSIAARLHREALIHENRIYPNNGTLPFKVSAAAYLQRLLGITVNPETEIVHCIGSKTALAQLPFAFINPGDSVVTTTPGYPVLPTIVGWLGGVVHQLPLTEAGAFLPDLVELESLAKKHNPKLVLLNYPNNPTGGIASLDFYRRVVELAHRYNFVVVQDGAYADFVFEEPYCSPLQVDGGRDCSIELYSLSKSFNMQGYRIGFAVSNPLLLKAYALVKDNIDNGQFIAIQKSGCEALDNGASLLASNKEKYRRRLAITASILRDAGIDAKPSAGSFYLYVKVPEQFQGNTFGNAQEFTNFLIAKHGIITVPWDDVTPHIRLSMTFEIGTSDFATEDDVFTELRKRLVG